MTFGHAHECSGGGDDWEGILLGAYVLVRKIRTCIRSGHDFLLRGTGILNLHGVRRVCWKEMECVGRRETGTYIPMTT
jgi:hypothetical protein